MESTNGGDLLILQIQIERRILPDLPITLPTICSN